MDLSTSKYNPSKKPPNQRYKERLQSTRRLVSEKMQELYKLAKFHITIPQMLALENNRWYCSSHIILVLLQQINHYLASTTTSTDGKKKLGKLQLSKVLHHYGTCKQCFQIKEFIPKIGDFIFKMAIQNLLKSPGDFWDMTISSIYKALKTIFNW